MKRGMKVYFAGIVIVLVLASVIIYCSRQTDIVEHDAYVIMLFEAVRNIAAGIVFALPFMQFVSIKAVFREKVLITIPLVVLAFGRIIYFCWRRSLIQQQHAAQRSLSAAQRYISSLLQDHG